MAADVQIVSPEGMRVAIIGMGRMGVRHLDAARRIGMSVCAVVDPSEQAIVAAIAQHGVGANEVFADATTMLESVRPEALVVATTAPTHASITIAAAQAGVRFILCEKPMAVSLAEAKAMIGACEAAGATLAINHQMRFMPQYSQVKALIAGEDYGPLSSIVVAGSNFGLAMNASHYFEMFRYITDRTVHSVQAWLDDERVANPRGAQFEDRAGRLLARTDGGPSMFIDFSASAGHGLQVIYICRNGQVVVDELAGTMHTTVRQAEFRSLPTTRYGMPADHQTYTVSPAETVAPTMDVWRAMFAGQNYPSGETGFHALSCLVAAHASHQAGGVPVRLDAKSYSAEKVFPWA